MHDNEYRVGLAAALVLCVSALRARQLASIDAVSRGNQGQNKYGPCSTTDPSPSLPFAPPPIHIPKVGGLVGCDCAAVLVVLAAQSEAILGVAAMMVTALATAAYLLAQLATHSIAAFETSALLVAASFAAILVSAHLWRHM